MVRKEIIRKSLELTPEQWEELDRIARATGSDAERGPTPGTASWRTLVRRIAERELEINAPKRSAERGN